MSHPNDEQTLVIPSGFQVESAEEGFSIANTGDVVLRGQVAFPLRHLTSRQGSVVLQGQEAVHIHRIEAPNGDIRVSGNLTAQTLVARRIIMLGGILTARQVVATEEIWLSGDNLQADMVMAPRVDIDPKLKGRATVLESKNDLGPKQLKGGFRLDEYIEIFPGGRDLLEQYPEVKSRLDSWADASPVAESSVAAELLEASRQNLAATSSAIGSEVRAARQAQNSQPIEISTAELEGDVLTLTEADHARKEQLQPEPEAREQEHDEDQDDSDDAQSSQAEESPVQDLEELYQRATDTFLKILSNYSDVKLPPPISSIEGLIEERRFEDLKSKINGLWHELLQYHKKERLQVDSTVTHNIQELKKLLSSLYP